MEMSQSLSSQIPLQTLIKQQPPDPSSLPTAGALANIDTSDSKPAQQYSPDQI